MKKNYLSNHIYYYTLEPKEKARLNNQIHDSIPEAIQELPRKILTPVDKLIYSHVYTQIIEDNYCNKKGSTLANELGASRRSVSRALHKFIKLNILSVDYQNNKLKRGKRIFFLSPNNYETLIKYDNKFKHIHNISTAKSKSSRQLKKPIRSHVNSHQNRALTITKSSQHHKLIHKIKKSPVNMKIIYNVAKEVHRFKPSYSVRIANNTITKEYLTGKVNINQLHDALIPALCADSKGKVKSFVGFLCYESTLPKDTLKAQSNIDNMSPKLKNYLENTSGSGETDFNF